MNEKLMNEIDKAVAAVTREGKTVAEFIQAQRDVKGAILWAAARETVDNALTAL